MNGKARMYTYMRAVTFFLLVGLLTGCAGKERAGSSSRAPVWQQGSPVVHIHPLDELDQQASVGILPFLMPAGVGNEQGRSVAGLFRDVFLGMRSFSTVRLLDDSYGSTEVRGEYRTSCRS